MFSGNSNNSDKNSGFRGQGSRRRGPRKFKKFGKKPFSKSGTEGRFGSPDRQEFRPSRPFRRHGPPIALKLGADSAQVLEMKRRIKDTFLEGVDNEKQIPVEEKIVEFIDREPEKTTLFSNLSQKLQDASVIKSQEDLKSALNRLVDIGVLESDGNTVRVCKQFC